MLLPLTITVLVGSVTAIDSAVALGWACGASTVLLPLMVQLTGGR